MTTFHVGDIVQHNATPGSTFKVLEVDPIRGIRTTYSYSKANGYANDLGWFRPVEQWSVVTPAPAYVFQPGDRVVYRGAGTSSKGKIGTIDSRHLEDPGLFGWEAPGNTYGEAFRYGVTYDDGGMAGEQAKNLSLYTEPVTEAKSLSRADYDRLLDARYGTTTHFHDLLEEIFGVTVEPEPVPVKTARDQFNELPVGTAYRVAAPVRGRLVRVKLSDVLETGFYQDVSLDGRSYTALPYGALEVIK